jgi:GntR family transcriptional regulator/MocR family aminotransferase
VVVPSQLVDGFIAERSVLDLFSPPLYQLALNEFLREGHFARHVRRTRAVYLQRRDALVEAIRRRLGETLSVVNADAGMHLTAWLPPDVDDREIARCAVERRISVSALSTCYSGSAARSGLILGFGGTDEARLVRAVAVLAQAIEESRHGRKRSVIRSGVAASR